MNNHPHCHCIVPGGGLSLDGTRWCELPRDEDLPQESLHEGFKKSMICRLRSAYRDGKLRLVGSHSVLVDEAKFFAWLKDLEDRRWNVRTEIANRMTHEGPWETLCREIDGRAHDEDALRTLKYLARYASGMSMSNQRILFVSDDRIEFSYKDYRNGGRKAKMSLPPLEFIRRFLFQVPPAGKRYVRHHGFLANNRHGQDKWKIVQQRLGLKPTGEVRQDDTEDQRRDDDGETQWEHKGPVCPQCEKGFLTRSARVDRPTVKAIMAISDWWIFDMRKKRQQMFNAGGFG